MPAVLICLSFIGIFLLGGAEWSKTPSAGDTIAIFFEDLIIVLPSPRIVIWNLIKGWIHYFSTIPMSHYSHVVLQSLFCFEKSLATFIIQKRTSSESFGQRSNSSFRTGSIGNEPFFALVAPCAPDFAPPENSDWRNCFIELVFRESGSSPASAIFGYRLRPSIKAQDFWH